ncbi:STAS domain-containing protein [Pararhizobium sp.]|uniref:STAS domain-containing protein n=1 Tax=Pararhizobium sp. TaxID=1977563 RepID=UPI003D13F297
MEISQRIDGATMIVSVSGRLDGNTASQLEEALAGPDIRAHGALIMDLARLDYVSSAGLRVMLKTAKASRAAKRKLVLAAVQPAVQDVFDISGFTALFVIVDTIEQAKVSLNESFT